MTTQVPALSAITFGQDSHNSVRRIGPSSNAFLAGAEIGGSGCSSSSTGISATARSDMSSPWPAVRRHKSGDATVRRCNDLFWSAVGCRAAMLPSTARPAAPCVLRMGRLHDRPPVYSRTRHFAARCKVSADRPYERWTAAGRRAHLHGDAPTAAGGQTLDQSLKCPGAGGMIILDTGHQFPGLLPDSEHATGFVRHRDVVLRLEQSAQKCRELSWTAASHRETFCDLIEKLHADQLAGQVQEVACVF